jgi:hypothetical protein
VGLKLDNINPSTLLIGAGLLAVAYLVWRGPGKVAADAVESIGSAFGIPETNTERCAQAKASGSLWDQSFYCTAPDFLGSLLTAPGRAIYSEDRPPLTVLEESWGGGTVFDEMGNVIY